MTFDQFTPLDVTFITAVLLTLLFLNGWALILTVKLMLNFSFLARVKRQFWFKLLVTVAGGWTLYYLSVYFVILAQFIWSARPWLAILTTFGSLARFIF